jgi:putative toxin-antitoxin system antitoxin component (TIGR02293 family)
MATWEYAVPAALLGLPQRVQSSSELVPVVREGFSVGAVQALAEAMNLHRPRLYELLGLSARTLRRRRHLTAAESDRVYRLARVFARALDVLDDHESAREWFHTPNRALGWVAPLDLVDTDVGARQVETVLGRIEHGVFS